MPTINQRLQEFFKNFDIIHHASTTFLPQKYHAALTNDDRTVKSLQDM